MVLLECMNCLFDLDCESLVVIFGFGVVGL